MLVKKILEHLELLAPLALAMNWDNCGLLLGSTQAEVDKVFVTLDVTPRAVDLAIEAGAQLILSHHPIIFRPINRITDPLLLKLIEHRIAVISLHTNLDVAP
ncbi:MAG TPA: Nif3-like dinuclear metal center hexameric protein, partial [Candidatus Cloacimonadota bacterium]|nr:Nif3-like dinuclear metal center hexameric protein [Candidatus Cloacimonadota bacterium]